MSGKTKRSNQHLDKIGSKSARIGEDLAPPLLDKVPRPPSTLRPAGRAKWRQICALLVEEELLTQWDLSALEMLCLEYERYLLCLADIEANGETFLTTNGYETKRPASTIRDKSFDRYTALLRRFGGDVAARAAMKRIRPREAKNNMFSEI